MQPRLHFKLKVAVDLMAKVLQFGIGFASNQARLQMPAMV
jgi:hypothetical protein